ncbi:hypothetical protein V6N13_057400 [Hibiscus sabdariffa]
MWRGEVVGKVIGKDVLNGIAQMAETCMVGYSREGLESTGVFLYESVMQWGIFLWVCVLIGSTKGLIWPCGMRGRIWVLVIRCVVDCIFLGTIRSVLDRQIQGLIRSVLGCQIKGLKRGVLENLFCALKIDVLSRVKRCVSTSAKYWVTLECWLVTDSTLRAQFGIEERNLEGWFERVVSSMADEVAKLMSNLNFSEEEMIEMEPMEGIGQEQQKRNGFQGVKRQGIVYTNKEMGGVVRGKQPEGSMQAGPRGGGRGQQGNVAQIRLRGPKRGLHGKYEVCTPVGSKKARSAPSSLVAEDDGNLEVVSPLKTTSTVEAVEQPRREP